MEDGRGGAVDGRMAAWEDQYGTAASMRHLHPAPGAAGAGGSIESVMSLEVMKGRGRGRRGRGGHSCVRGDPAGERGLRCCWWRIGSWFKIGRGEGGVMSVCCVKADLEPVERNGGHGA